MPEIAARFARLVVLAGLLAATCLPVRAGPADHLAPGFQSRPAASRLLLLPADIELYSISAGGVAESRADWTAAAQRNFGAALEARRARLGAGFQQLEASQAEEFAEIVTLQRAVAQAIAMHHDNGMMSLAAKGDRLDWSMGDAVRPLQERTGADYALFTWIRDSYASGQRKALMLGVALLGGIARWVARLFAATFVAPRLSFYERLLPMAEAVVQTARIKDVGARPRPEAATTFD